MAVLAMVLAIPVCLCAQTAEVTLRVQFVDTETKRHAAPLSAEAPVVVWLSPLDRSVAPPRVAQTFHMVQKHREFVPHLLVVPVGSTIDFPNVDPFFHNVFSLFNGRRFDLGLYQTGKSKSTRFDREGVSYIFCNIHPEMGGIIVSLATPYFTTAASGAITLSGVPAGNYMLHVWSERATQASMRDAERKVTVAGPGMELTPMVLRVALANGETHKNMFGEDYGQQR